MWMSTKAGMRWVSLIGSRMIAVYVGPEVVTVFEEGVESYLDMYALRPAIMSGEGEKIDIVVVVIAADIHVGGDL